MRYISRVPWYQAMLILLTAAVMLRLVYGCGYSAGLRPPGMPAHDGSFTGIAAVIARVAVVTAYVASFALVLCGVAVFLPFIVNKFAIVKYAAGAFTALIIAGLLYFLAEHYALAIGLALVCLGGGILWVGYCHRKDLEKRLGIDIDKDGKVG